MHADFQLSTFNIGTFVFSLLTFDFELLILFNNNNDINCDQCISPFVKRTKLLIPAVPPSLMVSLANSLLASHCANGNEKPILGRFHICSGSSLLKLSINNCLGRPAYFVFEPMLNERLMNFLSRNGTRISIPCAMLIT